jgi:endonuclease/exonuclease/phosphatase family metal-dependent hydrolase
MLSVLTFNCNKGNCNIQNIGKILVDSNADVICLQEFNDKVANSLKQYKLENSYVFITSPMNQGWSSNVIYSRFPVIKSKFYDIKGKARQNIHVTVLVNNQNVDVVSVHLESGRSNTIIRNEQYTTLLQSVSCNMNNKPIIVTGDFNMSVNETLPWPPINWNSAPILNTFNSENPCTTSYSTFHHPFDRCIYQNLTLLETRVIGIQPVGSDHYGLVNIFKLNSI